MRGLLIVAILALMAVAIIIAPHRSIGLADRLYANDGLYPLSPEERSMLSEFLSELLAGVDGAEAFAINEKYKRGRLNIYIVDEAWDTASGWKHGNASYAKASDTLFVDASYLREGTELVFSNGSDGLTLLVMAVRLTQSFEHPLDMVIYRTVQPRALFIAALKT